MGESQAGRGGAEGSTFQSVRAGNTYREVVVTFRKQQHRYIPAEVPFVLEMGSERHFRGMGLPRRLEPERGPRSVKELGFS